MTRESSIDGGVALILPGSPDAVMFPPRSAYPTESIESPHRESVVAGRRARAENWATRRIPGRLPAAGSVARESHGGEAHPPAPAPGVGEFEL